jgi:hypothetical protein
VVEEAVVAKAAVVGVMVAVETVAEGAVEEASVLSP